MNPGRNDPCHCGSGRKYKKCCETADDARVATEMAKAAPAAEAGEKAEPAQKTQRQSPGEWMHQRRPGKAQRTKSKVGKDSL